MIQADNLSFAALTTSGKASKGSHFSNDSCSCKEVTSCVLDLILCVSLRWFSLFSVYKKQNPALWHHWLQGLPLKTNALTRFQIFVEHFNFWNSSENSYFFYNVSEFKLRSYFEKKKKDKKLPNLLLFELYRGPAEDTNSGPGFTHQPPYGLQLNRHSYV